MKKYKKYKNSGIPWLGDIPEHWEIGKLKYLTNRIVDGTHFTPTYSEKGIPFLRITDLKNKQIDFNSIKYIPVEEHQELIKRCKPEKGDVLLSKNGTIGITKIIDWDWGFSIFVSICLIKLKLILNAKYFTHLFGSKAVEVQITESGQKTSIVNLHLEKIRKLTCILPPKPEQTAIANFLDYKLEKIDRFISKKKQLIELLDEQKAAILNQAVTKGLNPNAQMKPSGIEWLGDIPEHWEVRKLKYLMVYFKGFAFKSEDFSDNGIPIIKVSNIKNGVIKKLTTYIAFDNQRDEFESVRLYRGDIIISTVGSKPEMLNSAVGQIGIIDDYLNKSYLNQNTMCIRPIKNAINEDFARYFLMSKYMRASFDSISLYIVNQAYLLVDEIMNIKVVIPNITKQQQIVNYIETETTKIEKTISTIEKEIALVEEYKTALIAEAVTGKIDVRKWSEPLIEND